MSVTFSYPRRNTSLSLLLCGVIGIYFFSLISSKAADWLSCSLFLSQHIFCYNVTLPSHLQHHLFSSCFITASETQLFPTFICFTQAMCQLCQPHQKYMIILSVSSRLSILTPEFEILNCTISHSPPSLR